MEGRGQFKADRYGLLLSKRSGDEIFKRKGGLMAKKSSSHETAQVER